MIGKIKITSYVICECPHCGATFHSHTAFGETTCCPECGRQQAATPPMGSRRPIDDVKPDNPKEGQA